MTITTKENANGKITAYYIDGVKTRKAEIEAAALAYDGVIEIDFYVAKNNFPVLFGSEAKIVFGNTYGLELMTETAAKALGKIIVKKYSTGVYSHIFTVTDPAKKIADKTVTFYPTDTPKPCTGKLFGYDVCEYHSVKEYISELKLTQSAVIMENLFKNANGTYSYDGWGRKTYYMTDCYRKAYYVAFDTENICLDAESTAQLIYAETQLKNIVNGSDGSEEDIDGDNVFDYLPALDELNDVDIDDDDNTPPAMSDDISDICKYNPDLEDDDKFCRLDWDDSATFIDERTGEEELAEFNALPVIPAGTLEPVIIDNGKTYTEAEYFAKTAPDKIVADKPKLTRKQIQKMIDSVIAERCEYYDALEEYENDDECPQMHIDYLHDMIEKLGNQYWELVKLYDNAPAEEIAG